MCRDLYERMYLKRCSDLCLNLNSELFAELSREKCGKLSLKLSKKFFTDKYQ